MIEENNEFIKTEDNKGITIIYKDLLNKEYDTNEDDFSNISRMARYTVKGVRDLGEYIDRSNALETVSGNSGMTLNLTLQKSISSSASVTFGVSNSVISHSVGFNVSKSYSVSHSGSYKVPSNVNRAVVTAYPLYNKYEYGIYLRGRMGQPDVRMKTGYALKPIGIHYEKSFR